jgi:hemoglobin
MVDTPTIYEWAGGREAFARWLDAFYDLVEGDELLAPLFGGKVTVEHRDHVTAWWCEVMGGPARYTAELGGYEHMLAKHRGLAISDDQRLRFVTLLSRAADLAGLPADPEYHGSMGASFARDFRAAKLRICRSFALLAQLVEHFHGKRVRRPGVDATKARIQRVCSAFLRRCVFRGLVVCGRISPPLGSGCSISAVWESSSRKLVPKEGNQRIAGPPGGPQPGTPAPSGPVAAAPPAPPCDAPPTPLGYWSIQRPVGDRCRRRRERPPWRGSWHDERREGVGPWSWPGTAALSSIYMTS